MFKKIGILILVMSMVLTFGGCGALRINMEKQYQVTYLDLFDTVTTIVGMAESEEEFKGLAENIHNELVEYHRLFDIYNTYEGINNLKTINDCAGKESVAVDERIIALLQDCRQYYEATDGKVNVAMGSVLKLWHEERNAGNENPSEAKLPEEDALKKAAEHMDIRTLIIDEENASIYISDSQMQLDVGAVAKGWATQRVAENAPSGLLISVGGNVCATGPKDEDGTAWVIGINDPDGQEGSYLEKVSITEGCVVTSGDYQRTYEVDGRQYHHIIDPASLYPSTYWSSVTIICGDSGIADMLSTALFLLDRESGQKLLDRYGAEAMWVNKDGTLFYSD